MSNNMHTFHRQLRTSFADGDTYQRSLARLSDAALVQMAALKSELSWDGWPSRSEPEAA